MLLNLCAVQLHGRPRVNGTLLAINFVEMRKVRWIEHDVSPLRPFAWVFKISVKFECRPWGDLLAGSLDKGAEETILRDAP